jgi:hypothetical protein
VKQLPGAKVLQLQAVFKGFHGLGIKAFTLLRLLRMRSRLQQ